VLCATSVLWVEGGRRVVDSETRKCKKGLIINKCMGGIHTLASRSPERRGQRFDSQSLSERPGRHPTWTGIATRTETEGEMRLLPGLLLLYISHDSAIPAGCSHMTGRQPHGALYNNGDSTNTADGSSRALAWMISSRYISTTAGYVSEC
jgi:hypothetical protein